MVKKDAFIGVGDVQLGCRTDADAEKVARSVGNSLLVKTSWYGSDPNWGRLADAAGYARVGLREDRLSIFYNDIPALINGNNGV